jgi:hypothetical protein
MMIPRLIHQIWLGEGPLPVRFERWVEGWRAMNPGWEHVLWTQMSLPRLGNQSEFEYAGPDQRVDIARYELLHEQGGLVVDLDVEPLRPLDSLLSEKLSADTEGFAVTDDGLRISAAVMGARPGHPLLAELVRALPGALVSRPGEPAESQTGAELLSRVQWQRLGRHEQALDVLEAQSFFPYLWNEAPVDAHDLGDSYGVKRWHASEDLIGADGEATHRREVFEEIFDKSGWGDSESRSGWGSTRSNTHALGRQLPALFRQLGVTSLLDVPCGDLNWMGPLLDDGLVKTYVGGDIVPRLVEALDARWGAPGRTFVHLDVVEDSLPRCDAVLCRDLLIHLPLREARRVLGNLASSGAKWLLVSTYAGRTANREARVGDWRALNLTRPPFDLPHPLALLPEGREVPDGGRLVDQCLGVWKAKDVRRALRA